ncbi:MAG: GldG family protein [Alphaproteobacteria bacterium]|nr:GldG family protein [Alphaproteobacteria bacterium]
MTDDSQTTAGRARPFLTPGRFLVLVIALGAVTFVALNVLANVAFSRARLDLTQNGLFTLSEGTVETLKAIDEPITLRFFYSEKVGTEYPQVSGYAQRVRDLLEEYRARAGGRLEVEFVDPEPFSPEEDLAVALGLTGASTQGGETLYFGLSGTNAADGHEAIAFFPLARERFLEYDLTELVAKLNAVKRPKLGLLTTIPMAGEPGNPMQPQSGSPSSILYDQLSDRFTIETLPGQFREVPADIDVLMIAHPGPLDDASLYAIDQFVLRGGRALVFLDPHAESVAGNPFQPGPAPPSSTLPKLLKAWGVEMTQGEIVGDRELAQLVATGSGGQRRAAPFVAWLGPRAPQFAAGDVVTADLDRLIFASAGALKPIEGAGTTFSPLVTTTRNAGLLPVDAVEFMPQPEDLQRALKVTDEAYTLAARISGPVKTAFPEGPPKDASADTAGGAQGEEKPDAPKAAPLAESKVPANIILVADTDILEDRFWAEEQNFLGRRVVVPRADNGDFVLGAVENLMGTPALISLRARASGERPFTLVEHLQRKAEQAYLAREQALQNEISETEKRLQSLQGEGSGVGEGGAVLTAAQRQEIARFREELIRARGELRGVQRSLRADIETLGAWLKFVNIVLVPLIVALVALALFYMRHRRRAARAAG